MKNVIFREIFEKNSKVGRKILATGNGRCNISNQNITVKNCNISNARTAIEVEHSENIQLLDNNLQYMDENILDMAKSFEKAD